MKCDEVKPVCGPCAKGNRQCVYGTLPTDTGDHGHALPSGPTMSPPSSRLGHHSQTSYSSNPDSRPVTQTWPTTPGAEDPLSIRSPQSTFSTSTGYGTEVAPWKWYGLLVGDAANGNVDLDLPSLDSLSDAALAQRCQLYPNGVTAAELASLRSPLNIAESVASLQNPAKLLQISAIAPTPSDSTGGTVDERQYWQAAEAVQLKDHEYDIFQRFVTGVSLWIDLFDPLKHFSTFVPHLALQNEGLMKAILALGARHLSIKPSNSGEANVDRTAAVQYYYETLQYLQSAMRYTSYKNSLELLATVLVVSTYEMIDGQGKGWERHLKGVFWIQRSRDINGESGGLEQAIWWAWLRQDMWAAFRERRRCFSFFKPTKPYQLMDMWDMASRVVYILAQSVNYSSEEEKQQGEGDLEGRILRANTLLNMLEEWRSSISVHFEALPVEGPSNRAFRPLWVHPPALGTSLQMYSMARILLLIHQPAAGGYLEYLRRDKIITECIDTIGGIALKLTDDASRLMSTQCMFAAGLFCTDLAKRVCITELIDDHSTQTGWPSNTNLSEELRAEWSQLKPG
ncbi:hypothetical protein BAUCODRAFT_60938 [Baudoinia panamericana UAMH 10762]|uniref:Zn(2)-C6 fungal-type domain-containing protein n=1 Tax=Baudoinia panamericana (strain UAMH 10762) TaxID=717646 RepID=M2MVN1_BAUPA|nr:uncharacterized protein BAUCODRAFT_60938 [Baudoinia panamericana UAMH 10762]EMD01012.1 hypothetical protein BAUCODRAFT_60938 [Baudoinia panamericana UAMH 10762]